jgi:hypothetical protein
MRTDCQHYESRTYSSGEAIRRCKLDAAPEAPWNCPEHCPFYERRKLEPGWQYGSMPSAATPAEPEPAKPDVAFDADVTALLESTEDILNAAGAEALAEQQRKANRKLFRKRKKR